MCYDARASRVVGDPGGMTGWIERWRGEMARLGGVIERQGAGRTGAAPARALMLT